MRQELKAGNRTIFSRALRAALQEVLDNHQQAILFLNRRGTSTYVFCRDCGASLDCPRCDIPLTYHAAQDVPVLSAPLQGSEARALSAPLQVSGAAPGGLICHTCGYRRKLPEKCPKCASRQIRQFGLGTEKVESEVLAQFPGSRVLRWDAETAKKKDAHDLLLSHFTAHRADILVGTQMIAKGLDLPLVTLVGVILADVGLQLPDFRAGERGFQLLTQVAGRAGRSPLGGRAIFQTYRPDHYAIQAAAAQDYEAFLRQELAHRRKLGYPPYSRLARLELRDKDEANAAKEAARMGEQVGSWIAASERRALEMMGPAPCFFNRRDGYYRWQIILRGQDPAGLLRGRPLGSWQVEIDPPSLL
jgi:primosomal protein N' (replication factor Y)